MTRSSLPCSNADIGAHSEDPSAFSPEELSEGSLVDLLEAPPEAT